MIVFDQPKVPINTRLVRVSNEFVSIGVDLDHGGAITWLSTESETAPDKLRGKNLINNYDLGRQLQMSHYAAPNPFVPEGHEVFPEWKKLGWNAVQAGDHFGNGSEVTEISHDETSIKLRCRPMQWPLDNAVSEAEFEMTIQLDGPIVRVHCLSEFDRSDNFEPEDRHQEIPALYVVSELSRICSPGEHGIETVTQKVKDKWTRWTPSLPWAAVVDDSDFGVGLLSKDLDFITGGLAGEKGSTDIYSVSTVYFAPVKKAKLPKTGTFEYDFAVTVGDLEQIDSRFQTELSKQSPSR